jgi:outer membrane receptor protein involved in Fe transport
LLIINLLLLGTSVFAQTETGQVTGTVFDQTGAVVPHASVTVESVGTGATRTIVATESGTYIVTNLLPGDYLVSASAAGFAETKERVTLTVGGKAALDLHLQLGKASTVVEVDSTAVQVNTETQTLSSTVSETQLRELPTLTRNPYDLVSLSGNVSTGGTMSNARGAGVSIDGQRESSTNVLLDGAANNDEFTASVGQAVPLDSIQEFSVLTNNFTAEYGRASGGIVNVVTKSGTNEFHGTAYEFNRVADLASNSFQNNATGTPRSPFTRNQFGYSAGGPVKKNKLFAFSSTEWIRVRSETTDFAVIPDQNLIAAAAANTQQYFSTYGKLTSGVNVLQTFTPSQAGCKGPLCTALSSTLPIYDLISYQVPSDSGAGLPENEYQSVDRVDYNLSDKTQIYARYAIQSQNQFAGTVSSSPYQGYNTGQTVFNNNILGSVIHTFSPAWVSQSKLVFNRLNNQQPFSSTYGAVPTLYTTSGGAGDIGGYSVIYPGYDPFTPGNGIPFGGPQNFAQVYEDVSYVRGKHSIRFGGSFEYLRDNRTFGAYETAGEYLGTNVSSSIDNFLAGQLHGFQAAIFPQGQYPGSTVSLPLTQPNFSRSFRYDESGLYVQDAWKVSPRLTLNLGLRWEYYGVQHDKNAALDSNFYFPSGQINTPQGFENGSVMLATASSVGGFWAPDYKDFAPRVGVAYDLFGNGKTSIRGGYGIGYERNFGNVTFNAIQNPPNYETISVTSSQLALPISVSDFGPFSGSSGTIKLPSATLRVPLQNITTAYAHLYSASLEHQLTNTVLVAADYSGSKGVNLYDIAINNRPGYGNVFLGIPCTGSDFNCTAKLNNQYGYMNTRGNGAFSDYNSLTLRTVFNNFGNSGVHATASYTWSHSIDNLSSTFSDADCFAANWGCFNTGELDPFNTQIGKGDSDYDNRQRLVVSAMWEVPVFKTGHGLAAQILGGWSLAPIFTARTGSPYTVFDCTNAYTLCPEAAFTSAVNAAANKNPAASSVGPNQFTYFAIPSSVDNFVNPTYGFSDLPPFPSDMSGRDAFRAPGFWQLDAGLHKGFRFTERTSLQIRVEAFNVFNHANLYVEGNTADVSANAAVLACKGCTGTSADRRNLQLAAKFIF